jgi:hypothetical protein
VLGVPTRTEILDRPWRTIMEPILANRSRKVVIDHCYNPTIAAALLIFVES